MSKEELFKGLEAYCKAVSEIDKAKAEYEIEEKRCRNAVPEGVYKNKFIHYFWPFVVFFFAMWLVMIIVTSSLNDYGTIVFAMMVLGIIQILVPIIGVGISWKLRDKQHKKVDEQIEAYRINALKSDSLKKLDQKVKDKEAKANELSKILPAKYRNVKAAQLVRKCLYREDINTIEEAVEMLNF